jgi:hypothetical protein
MDPQIAKNMDSDQLKQSDWWSTMHTIYVLWELQLKYPLPPKLNMPKELGVFIRNFLDTRKKVSERGPGEDILNVLNVLK